MYFQFIKKYIFSVSILLFLFSAFAGLLIRLQFVFPLHLFEYKNLLQGHSHAAFLGWGYFSTIGAIFYAFVPSEKWNNLTYKLSLLIMVFCVVCMLFSFPVLGYKAFSIALLAVFGVASYFMSFRLLKDIKSINTSTKFVKYGIYYYLISSLATWFLVYVIMVHGKSNLYYNTVYFYLHFLYNGFFVFALFGLLFFLFEKQQFVISERYKQYFFVFLNVACLPSYVLSILWSGVGNTFYIIGFVAALLQVVALFFLMKIVSEVRFQIKWNSILKMLFYFFISSFCIKIVSQLASSFPYFVEKSIALKPYFIIGYIHLFTLGFLSTILFFILLEIKKIKVNSTFSKMGILLFLIGVFCTEFILFYQGFAITFNMKLLPNQPVFMLVFSGVIVLGLLIFTITHFVKNELKI